MSETLITVDEQSSLSHYRTKGSKNGVRQYQNKDGSLTPEGYRHYAEMYGWGKRELNLNKKRDKYAQKADRIEDRMTARKERSKDGGLLDDIDRKKLAKSRSKEAIFDNLINTLRYNRSQSELRKALRNDAKTGLNTASLIDKKNERSKRDREDAKKREDEQKEISKLSDDDLNKKLARLQKEKQVSELLNERANREKGPLRAAASKLLKEAAENFARKALNEVVDQVITKAKNKAKDSFKLSDYKDVDPYSLSTDKLKAVSEAFNNAANMVRNKYPVEHEGRSPGGDNNNGGGQQQSQQTSNTSKSSGESTPSNGSVSKGQRKKMRSMASSGKSAAEIAKEFGVSESTVYKYAGEQLKKDDKS